MEIKRFGAMREKTIMLLHGNLMCWRQFEDLIPLLEKNFRVYAVSFDGFDGTDKTTTRLPGIRRTSWRLISKKNWTDGWICFMQSRWAVDRPFF